MFSTYLDKMAKSIERLCRAERAKQKAWRDSAAFDETIAFGKERGYSDELVAQCIDATFEEEIHKIITGKKR